MELPKFKYHPDPVATGSIAPSVAVCPVCKQASGDAAEFLGLMGKEDLVKMGRDFVEMIKAESGLEGDDGEYYFSRLDREFDATAYLFRCRHCGKFGGCSDCH